MSSEAGRWAARTLCESQRLVEQRDRRRELELVAADREAIENVGELELSVVSLHDLARAHQELDRLLDLPELLKRPGLAREDAELEPARARARDSARTSRYAPTASS